MWKILQKYFNRKVGLMGLKIFNGWDNIYTFVRDVKKSVFRKKKSKKKSQDSYFHPITQLYVESNSHTFVYLLRRRLKFLNKLQDAIHSQTQRNHSF